MAAFDIPEGQFPKLIGWRQGEFINYLDLETGQLSHLDTPAFGVVPDFKGGTPFETLRVITTTTKRPGRRRIDMGIVSAVVDQNTITFAAKRRRRTGDRTFRARTGKL